MSFENLYTLTPGERGSPVFVEVPHAGLAIPEAVAEEISVEADWVWKDADLFVDRLYEYAPSRGASMLVAHVSRYVVDLNRAGDDVDPQAVAPEPADSSPLASLEARPSAPSAPRGVVWRCTTSGESVLRRPLSPAQLRSRVARFHAPYHDALRTQLESLRATYGYAILVAAHSMPSYGRPSGDEASVRRADIVPGTLGRTTADALLIDAVDAHFRAAGLSVRHDDPYRGGYTTQHYGRPHEHWHTVQIELNRALYVDESTGRPKDGDFEALQSIVTSLIDVLVDLRLSAV